MANGAPQGFHICTAVSGVGPRSNLSRQIGDCMVFHSSLARAAHRSGVALIAIADSVAAAMVEGADHGGALRPHLTARAASVRKSRRCRDRLPSSKRAVSIL